MIGLTEERVHSKRASHAWWDGRIMPTTARGQIIGDTHGLLKLVFSSADKKLLGVHIFGEMASELIHIGAQVMAGAARSTPLSRRSTTIRPCQICTSTPPMTA